MTKQQYKLCKAIVRYRYMDIILDKMKLSDYYALYDSLGPSNIETSDCNMDSKTIVKLKSPLLDEFEAYRTSMNYKRLTLFFSALAAITGIVQILSDRVR